VRGRLLYEQERQLGRELATVERTYREEPAELPDLDPHWGITRFQIVDSTGPFYQTDGWQREGLTLALPKGGGPARRTCVSRDARPYRVATVTSPSYQIAVAMDETPIRQALWTLVPVGAMAAKARKITAESLGERLPVENPEHEFGRLRRVTADASHELRTPLTAIRSVGEVALQGRSPGPNLAGFSRGGTPSISASSPRASSISSASSPTKRTSACASDPGTAASQTWAARRRPRRPSWAATSAKISRWSLSLAMVSLASSSAAIVMMPIAVAPTPEKARRA
jgi:signal transduction histidine kinase